MYIHTYDMIRVTPIEAASPISAVRNMYIEAIPYITV